MIKSFSIKPINFIFSIDCSLIIAGVFIYCILPPYDFLYDIFHNISTSQSILEITLFFAFVLIIWVLGIILPIYVAYNHYQYDKTTIITIDDKTDEIIYFRKGKSIKFKVADIDRYITAYSWLNSITERYKIIWLKSGEKIIVTSFLSGHLYKYLKKVPWKDRTMYLPLLDVKNEQPKYPYYLVTGPYKQSKNKNSK